MSSFRLRYPQRYIPRNPIPLPKYIAPHTLYYEPARVILRIEEGPGSPPLNEETLLAWLANDATTQQTLDPDSHLERDDIWFFQRVVPPALTQGEYENIIRRFLGIAPGGDLPPLPDLNTLEDTRQAIIANLDTGNNDDPQWKQRLEAVGRDFADFVATPARPYVLLGVTLNNAGRSGPGHDQGVEAFIASFYERMPRVNWDSAERGIQWVNPANNGGYAVSLAVPNWTMRGSISDPGGNGPCGSPGGVPQRIEDENHQDYKAAIKKVMAQQFCGPALGDDMPLRPGPRVRIYVLDTLFSDALCDQGVADLAKKHLRWWTNCRKAALTPSPNPEHEAHDPHKIWLSRAELNAFDKVKPPAMNHVQLDLSNHGPFVMDLLYREIPAPYRDNVELVLVETLNQHATGHIATFTKVLAWLQKDIAEAPTTGEHKVDCFLVNMSCCISVAQMAKLKAAAQAKVARKPGIRTNALTSALDAQVRIEASEAKLEKREIEKQALEARLVPGSLTPAMQKIRGDIQALEIKQQGLERDILTFVNGLSEATQAELYQITTLRDYLDDMTEFFTTLLQPISATRPFQVKFIAAAGNDAKLVGETGIYRQRPAFPASLPRVLGVAALAHKDTGKELLPAGYSNIADTGIELVWTNVPTGRLWDMLPPTLFPSGLTVRNEQGVAAYGGDMDHQDWRDYQAEYKAQRAAAAAAAGGGAKEAQIEQAMGVPMFNTQKTDGVIGPYLGIVKDRRNRSQEQGATGIKFNWVEWMGTSMATPKVTGRIATWLLAGFPMKMAEEAIRKQIPPPPDTRVVEPNYEKTDNLEYVLDEKESINKF